MSRSNIACVLVGLGLGGVLAGCCNPFAGSAIPPTPETMPTVTAPAPAPAGTTTTPPPAATPGAAARPTAPADTLPGSISITMLDRQLFHPNTRRRLMADPRNPSDVSAESS